MIRNCARAIALVFVIAISACGGNGGGNTIPVASPTAVTASPSAAVTGSANGSQTATPIASPSASTTPGVVATSTAGAQSSPTATAPATPSAAPSSVASPAPTATTVATQVPTHGPSATATPTATSSPTVTPVPTATATPTATVTPSAAGTPAITGLHVVGNAIENGAGVAIVPHGVDRPGTEYACIQNNGIFDGPNDQTSVSAMASWHINAVRVPLNEDCWLAINGAPAAYSGSAYRSAIASYVALLNANGLLAILDLHWNNGGTNQATGQEPMADADHAPAFWSSVGAAFANDGSVIFDLYNEPYVTSWSCWRDGGTASACNTPFDIAGMNALISAVRSSGANNVVLAGGLAYANDLSQWLQFEPTDPAGNLAASWHIYNNTACNTTSCYDSAAANVAASVPIVAGEIGEYDCTHAFIDTLMPYLDAHAIGYLGWAWNASFDCSSGPGLISNYDGTPTNYGVGLQAHFANLATAMTKKRRQAR